MDYLIYNAPLEYLELVLSGEIEGYLRKCTDYSRLDEFSPPRLGHLEQDILPAPCPGIIGSPKSSIVRASA